jgi:hypothetical protein
MKRAVEIGCLTMEIGRTIIQGQPRQKVCETSISKKKEKSYMGNTNRRNV